MITMFHKGRDVWLDISYKSVFARVDRSSFIVSLPKVSLICFGRVSKVSTETRMATVVNRRRLSPPSAAPVPASERAMVSCLSNPGL